MLKRLTCIGLAVAFGLGLGSAQAVTIQQGLVNGFNLVIDESREAFVDNPGGTPDGRFGVGDVIFGYIKIDNFSTSGQSANNQVYGIFSQTVTNVTGQSITFGATTATGLKLSDLSGCTSCANGIFALFDRTTPYSTDLILANPPGATNMFSYLNFIRTNGGVGPSPTLELVGGFDLGFPTDFLVSASAFAGASTGGFIGLPSSVAVADTGAALSITTNNIATLMFIPDVLSVTPVGYLPFGAALSSLGVSGGAVSGTGAAAPSPQFWLIASGFTQCDADSNPANGVQSTPCGFIDKNNFNVDVKAVPEPGSILLLSVALMAAGGAGRLRKRGSVDG